MCLKNLSKKINSMSALFDTLLKLNMKVSKDDYKKLNIDGFLPLELSRQDIKLLTPKFGKYFIFSEEGIGVK